MNFKDNELEVSIRARGVTLFGDLYIPESAKGLILFAHGSGSSRKSVRNKFIANSLNRYGFATLLFDLLTPIEEEFHSNVFDIPLLSKRLLLATRWVSNEPYISSLPIGYFGASTGAAAALCAASVYKNIFTVVSRGGRVDMASRRLRNVDCPVLLIVGGRDVDIIDINREAALSLGDCKMEIVPGATHLFEESRALDKVLDLTRSWLEVKLYSYKLMVGGEDHAYRL